jgi:hypothetical protein
MAARGSARNSRLNKKPKKTKLRGMLNNLSKQLFYLKNLKVMFHTVMVVLVNTVNIQVVVVMLVVFIIIVHYLINTILVISVKLVNENFTNLKIVDGVHQLILIVYGHY